MAKYARVDEAPLRSWLTLLGIIPLYGSIGFAMTGYINFWLGVGIIVLSTLAFAVHFWLSNKAQSQRLRVSGVIVIVTVLLCTLWIVFVSAPLQVVIDVPPGNYPKGQQIFGIEWMEGYSPVNVTASNNTDIVYENFDSYFRTDGVWIARAGVNGGINQCVATPENTLGEITQASFSIPDKKLSIPLFQSDKQFPASIYRVRCDKLAPHSHIEILLAINNPKTPEWAIGSFRFNAANRHRGPFFIPKCFFSSCPDMPATFVGG